MSNELAPYDIIQGSAEKFHKIASNGNINIEFVKEASFAVQQIYKNDKSIAAAKGNPTSLQYAMANVASVGLSLNPATAYAYLVPRDNAICLDISYRGLIKIATDTGSIMWAQAEVVYSTDTFEFHGPTEKPVHSCNPFVKKEDRGDLIGVYCIAKTCDGDYLVEAMSAEDVNKIREKSPSAHSQYSPWHNFEGEMWKKCVIKRGSKTWPKTERHERLDTAIEHINQAEGIDLNERKQEDYDLMSDYLHEKNGAAIANLRSGDADESLYWAKIQKSFADKGKKGKHGEMVEVWISEAIEYVLNVAAIIERNPSNRDAVMEAYNELNKHEVTLFENQLEPEQKINIENILHSLKGDE